MGGDWLMSPSNAAKGAVGNLTRALAMDLGKKGVRVNSVCPSLTRMTADMMDDKDLLSKFAEQRIHIVARTAEGTRHPRCPTGAY
jgi:meso-butanediol dehydrogenase/(S,S)-butanediol dehydrogenase/diacetyl reductase